VQQDYFEGLEQLDLKNCKRLNTGDLLTIIKASHEEFDLESFIKPENLPNSNSDLVTNEVLKAISQSTSFQRSSSKITLMMMIGLSSVSTSDYIDKSIMGSII
jgi:hypothetical protein